MSDIITCSCGAKLKLPEESAGRAFRCPQCKMGIALTADAKVLAATEAKGDSPIFGATQNVASRKLGQSPGATCPICQTAIAADQPAVACPGCDQMHHQECWAEVGGCGTYGCPQAPSVQKSAAAQPQSAWGDTKVCPVCKETIKSIALRCRYCGTDFHTTDPLTLAAMRRKADKDQRNKGLVTTVVILFAVSLLIGCLAPLTLIVGLGIVVPNRRRLAEAGAIYAVLGYGAVLLSLLYSILMVVMFVRS